MRSHSNYYKYEHVERRWKSMMEHVYQYNTEAGACDWKVLDGWIHWREYESSDTERKEVQFS